MAAPTTTEHPDDAVAAGDVTPYDKRWWTLGVLCLSLLIVFVGNSSLNVAIPTLSRELDASTSQLQWVVASYSLVFAGLLFTAGAVGDRFGRKGALQAGLIGPRQGQPLGLHRRRRGNARARLSGLDVRRLLPPVMLCHCLPSGPA